MEPWRWHGHGRGRARGAAVQSSYEGASFRGALYSHEQMDWPTAERLESNWFGLGPTSDPGVPAGTWYDSAR